MKELKRLNSDCFEFFSHRKIEKWTQSHDKRYRYRWMTTNLAKCMNVLMEFLKKNVTHDNIGQVNMV